MTPPRPKRFKIVADGQAEAPLRRYWWLLPLWLLSLLLVAWLAHSTSGGSAGALQDRQALAKAQQQIEQLTRQQATAQASDRISRAALTDVQASLAEREEEIAGLRADVAFYERLVGSTSQRKGLNAHSVEFSQEAAGSWHYTVVLTQNLNRGAISQGQMRFSVEGVKDGKLTTVSWDELHQRQGVAGQAYSFRYFQQLDGSVMLPADFTPQRVRVSLSGSGGNTVQTFDWKLASGARGG
ncbi:hypothetical protein H4O09_01750 [Stenotrophomonas sp. W1S232]|uniref:Uncharacterized protein n=1 Tax=Stenotrophomonas koreensis TaxID=266128 RepID=A0A7W3UXU3_9GAMM|nr:DUF6776 family protein [Stenotrophomonas koreensis]MBB1115791.1 hypothetical protein [Stenotrophomonas koreensis]